VTRIGELPVLWAERGCGREKRPTENGGDRTAETGRDTDRRAAASVANGVTLDASERFRDRAMESRLSNNRMKLTSGEGCARPTGAHSRAQRAASWVAARSLSWCSTHRSGPRRYDASWNG